MEVVDVNVTQVVQHRQVMRVVRSSDVNTDERHPGVTARDEEATSTKSVQASPSRRQKCASRPEDGSNLG